MMKQLTWQPKRLKLLSPYMQVAVVLFSAETSPSYRESSGSDTCPVIVTVHTTFVMIMLFLVIKICGNTSQQNVGEMDAQ